MLAAHMLLELTQKAKKFLSHFPGTLYTYIPDHNDEKPVIHSEVLDLTRQEEGYGVFFTVNGFFDGKRDGAHLKSVNAFFCDIDYPDKINQTEEKIRQYKNDMTMEMVDSGMIPSAIVETKNGLHVYWFLEEPIHLSELNPDQVENLKKAYRDIEESILKKFDGDPGAKDLARVLRVPGTLHQKDPKDPFNCELIHFCEDNVYSFKEIRAAFLAKDAPDSWAEVNSENPINDKVKYEIEREYPKLSRPSYQKLLAGGGDIPEGMRNKALLVAAHAVKEAGWSIEKSYDHFAEYAGLSTRETRKTIKSAYDHSYDFGYNNEIMNALADPDERKKLSEITSKALSKETKDDREKSNFRQKELYQTYEMIISARYPTLKYKERGDFYIYKDGVYKAMHHEQVQALFMREMLRDGLTNWRKVGAINDKMACFKSLDKKTFAKEEANPNPNVLNFKNGFLDISTFKLYQHTPIYLSTTQAPIVYDPRAVCPRWKRFLHEIMLGDEDQIRLLRQIAGYCLTTDTKYQMAFIFTGSGGNGKGTFTRLLQKLVGETESTNLDLETILRPFGALGLVDKRLCTIDEISGRYFESNRIKKLIAADPMSIEVKYRPEPFDFKPTVKFIFNVNDLPKINDTTPAIYRRFTIIPFERSFNDNPDIFLENKLGLELPGILNWAIEGLKDLREAGTFIQTEKNIEAMSEFKSDNSPLVEFLSIHYEPTPRGDEGKYGVPMGELYNQYRNYCAENGYKPKAQSNFTKEISHLSMKNWIVWTAVEGRKKLVYGIRRIQNLSGHDIIYPPDGRASAIAHNQQPYVQE